MAFFFVAERGKPKTKSIEIESHFQVEIFKGLVHPEADTQLLTF